MQASRFAVFQLIICREQTEPQSTSNHDSSSVSVHNPIRQASHTLDDLVPINLSFRSCQASCFHRYTRRRPFSRQIVLLSPLRALTESHPDSSRIRLRRRQRRSSGPACCSPTPATRSSSCSAWRMQTPPRARGTRSCGTPESTVRAPSGAVSGLRLLTRTVHIPVYPFRSHPSGAPRRDTGGHGARHPSDLRPPEPDLRGPPLLALARGVGAGPLRLGASCVASAAPRLCGCVAYHTDTCTPSSASRRAQPGT